MPKYEVIHDFRDYFIHIIEAASEKEAEKIGLEMCRKNDTLMLYTVKVNQVDDDLKADN